jgi:hypothetical protein
MYIDGAWRRRSPVFIESSTRVALAAQRIESVFGKSQMSFVRRLIWVLRVSLTSQNVTQRNRSKSQCHFSPIGRHGLANLLAARSLANSLLIVRRI